MLDKYTGLILVSQNNDLILVIEAPLSNARLVKGSSMKKLVDALPK